MTIFQGAARHPVRGIVIHCTATPANWRPGDTPQARLAAIRDMHTAPPPRGRGWRDIGYHWLIDRDGTILRGRPETQIGAHVAGHNSGTLGISLFGGIDSRPDDPFEANFTGAQATALEDLIEHIRSRTRIDWIRGHHDFDRGKACPGFRVAPWLKAAGLA